MDLNSIFQLMVAASLERDKSIRVTDQISCNELLRLAGAGLVEISIHGEQTHPEVTVKRLTARGLRVLRAFATPLPGLPPVLKAAALHLPKIGRVSGRAKPADLRSIGSQRRPPATPEIGLNYQPL